MTISGQIAKSLREVYFGGNWTTSNVKDNLAGLDWEQATTKVYAFNTIATLVYHTHYYVHAVLQVLQGAPLDAHDSRSFDYAPVQSPEDWERLLQTVFTEAETFAQQIEQLPDDLLLQPFTDEKYGNYYRNLQGIIEHLHYHLGQIVLIRKIIQSGNGALKE